MRTAAWPRPEELSLQDSVLGCRVELRARQPWAGSSHSQRCRSRVPTPQARAAWDHASPVRHSYHTHSLTRMHALTRSCAHARTHTCTGARTHRHMIHIHMYSHVHTHTCTYTLTHIHTLTRACTHSCRHTHVGTHELTREHAHSHTYTHARTYTLTRMSDAEVRTWGPLHS